MNHEEQVASIIDKVSEYLVPDELPTTVIAASPYAFKLRMAFGISVVRPQLCAIINTGCMT